MGFIRGYPCFIAAALFATLMSSCTIGGGGIFINPIPAPPTAPPTAMLTMAILPANPTVYFGNTLQLDVEFRDQNGVLASPPAGGTLAWSAPVNTAFTVDSATGLVTTIGTDNDAVVTATFTSPTDNLAATTTVSVSNVPAASITVSPSTPSISVGDNVQLTATVRDASGNPLAGRAVTWESADPGVAPVGVVTGNVTGVAAGGPVTIRATADENMSIFGDAQVTVTALSSSLIAYAIANQHTAASYVPDLASQYNGQGGPLTVTRLGTGQYDVTIPGFGGSGSDSRIPFVNALNAAAVTCLPASWTMIGVADAAVRVNCSDTAGVLTDSRFTIFTAGQGALPGRFAFAHSGPVASFPAVGATAVPLGTASAWSSGGSAPTLALTDTGRYKLGLKLSFLAAPDVPVTLPAGAAGARCTLSSWGTFQDVVCFPLGGGSSFANAPFNGMFVDEGRPGKRFGAAHSALASPSRNSSGGSNVVSSLGTGHYRVTFGGLGHPSGGKETVLVTTHALYSAASCNPTAWPTAGSDLVVDVQCFDGAGAASNEDFIAVVIE